jgi:hypothetical protein
MPLNEKLVWSSVAAESMIPLSRHAASYPPQPPSQSLSPIAVARSNCSTPAAMAPKRSCSRMVSASSRWSNSSRTSFEFRTAAGESPTGEGGTAGSAWELD